MNIEIYSYSILASILGIIIVFLSLCSLSLLMVGLKMAFGVPLDRQKEDVVSQPVSAASKGKNWVVAAVAAFLAVEEEQRPAPRVGAWVPRISEKSDIWMNGWTVHKK